MFFSPGLVRMRGRPGSRLMFVTLVAWTLATSLAAPAGAQRRSRYPNELRGSQASVQKMWDFAQTHGLTFYKTSRDIDEAIVDGRLVALTGDSTYAVTRAVRYAYATREARQFVVAFAPQYLAACGAPLTVTSAARPTNRQPRNSNPFSVHPTGIAVDLRRPPAGRCQTWLRQALAELEMQGYVEATEERRPVHLHVAVLTEPGKVVALPPLVTGTLARNTPRPQQSNGVLSETSAAIRTNIYKVREGDTLWDVARRSGVSVRALARANHRSERAVLRAGTTLRVPDRPSS